jgi:hypothetical protein
MTKTFLDSEKGSTTPEDASGPVEIGQVVDDGEIFKSDGEVNFRTVGWVRASVIFLKSENDKGMMVIHFVLTVSQSSLQPVFSQFRHPCMS